VLQPKVKGEMLHCAQHDKRGGYARGEGAIVTRGLSPSLCAGRHNGRMGGGGEDLTGREQSWSVRVSLTDQAREEGGGGKEGKVQRETE
ncbi:MAG: hypothetical protein WCP58_03290, partial [bacterium]